MAAMPSTALAAPVQQTSDLKAASESCGGTSHMLPLERQRASFDTQVLLKIIGGGRADRIAKFKPLFDKAPFNDQHLDVFRSYEEKFQKSVQRATEAFRIVRSNPEFYKNHTQGKLPMESFFEHNGIYVHFTMTLQFIMAQASDDQKKKWLKKARAGEFVCAYCQTELGHGSNVRGLETTATYDPITQEFEIHSPNLTSLKWWPTGMHACTHALVFANLITDGKPRGFTGFMVQLRTAEGETMPGVELGEIGPKMNANNVNIGYCRFTRVRVPHENMFSKYSRVAVDGSYKAAPPKLSKYRYISLMHSRTSIIAICYRDLAKASTVAIRYSAVRRQGFKDGEATGEHVILDYQNQQLRVLKAAALAYCVIWNSRYIRDFITRVQKGIEQGDESAADDLPELHATLSGIKVVATTRAHEAIEECRKCCGGQGFLLSSGVARMSGDFSEWVTVEGEQVILSLQLARFLVKAVADVDAGKRVAASVAYIAEATKPKAALDTESVLGCMASRARRMAKRLAGKVRESESQGQSFEDALTSHAVLAYRAAGAHSTYQMLLNNFLALESYFKEQPAVRAVLERLLSLLALTELTERGRDWAGELSEELFDAADDRVAQLLAEIRPDAVSLADAFGFSDEQLQSTLGRHDGNVYEAIYEAAKMNPVNRAGPMVGWEDFSSQLDLDFLREEAQRQRTMPAAKL